MKFIYKLHNILKFIFKNATVTYLGALLSLLLYFFISLLTLFGLVELYEPFFAQIPSEDLEYRFFWSVVGDLAYVDKLLIGILLWAIFLSVYLFLQYNITINESKKLELKNLFVRKLFLVMPVYVGVFFLVFFFFYTLFSFLSPVNLNYNLGVFLKFLVSILVFLPTVLYNLILLSREGKTLVQVFLMKL